MTDTEASAAIAVLRDAYPRQPFPDSSVSFYARKLADIPGPELIAAVDRLTNRSAWLPSIAEIRREVAEQRLALPDAAEAWEIATSGALNEAPAEVRLATRFVGGRWAILRDDNTPAVRAQFRDQYNRLRERALDKESGALPPRLPSASRLALPVATYPGTMTEGLASPVMQRAARAMMFPDDKPAPPTEEEKQDALRILERNSWNPDDPASDYLYKAAELVMVHASVEDA